MRDLLTSKVHPVEIDGATYYVRKISLADWLGLKDAGTGERRLAQILCASACDADGKRIFTDADLPAIEAMPYQSAQPAITKALEINGLSSGTVDAEKKD